MKLRKLISMGIAAIMAVSAMSVSVFAAESNETESTYDFYTTKQILTYNPETGEFDSTYEEISPISLLTSGYTFTFSQTVTSAGRYLINTADKWSGSNLYLVGDDDTLCITLDNKPSEDLSVKLYTPSGSNLGPVGTITTKQTQISLTGLSDSYNLIGSLRIQIKTEANAIDISGSVTES